MFLIMSNGTKEPSPNISMADHGTLYIAVMDPLALENACACVEGFAQRDYKALAEYLKAELECEVELVFRESIEMATKDIGHKPDILIGKKSVIEYDAGQTGSTLENIAMLTGPDGKTTLTGLFVVKNESNAKQVSDLKSSRIAIGPKDSDEKNSAALALLKENSIYAADNLIECGTCSISTMKVINGEADAAVISSYAMPLLVGCQTMSEGELKVIGETRPVPFVAVYATDRLNKAYSTIVKQALLDVSKDKDLKIKLESRDGFVESKKKSFLPSKLPAEAKFIWSMDLSSQSLGGICATDEYVIVSDKTADGIQDLWRCLDATTGDEVWQLKYDAAGEMDYTNSPRASAAIKDDKVYLLGAFGDLHCVDLSSGSIIWKCDLIEKFGGEVPTWGFCGTPLLVDNKVIVSTASTEAALVALDCDTGKMVWQCQGIEPGYGSFIVGTFGGKRQIVGHDAKTLGGWDIDSGKRLWTVKPPQDHDFNVPTPLQVGDKLLAATENNGARLYAFNNDGTIQQEPTAINEDFAPDIASPVLVDGLIWGVCYGGMSCIDPANGLETVWISEDEPFNDHASFIAGRGNLLVVLKNGMISVMPSRPEKNFIPATLTVFESTDDFDPEVWSQPALVDNRLYLRSESRIACLLLNEPAAANTRASAMP